jgi:SAM-dependent methyltransferase
LAMKNPETRRLREAWIPQARGDVLEVGIGSGLNLEFYTQRVRRVQGVDTSVELQRMARKRAARMNVEFLLQSAENLARRRGRSRRDDPHRRRRHTPGRSAAARYRVPSTRLTHPLAASLRRPAENSQ